MSNRPEDDDGRRATLIDPMASATARPVTERLVLPGSPIRGSDDPVVVVGNRYEIRELLGSGGMCDVWRAHDPVLEREVAVKKLLPRWRDDPRVRERFAAEALRVAKLSHPSIVGVLDAGADAAGPFLVMELIDGQSLDQRLAAEGRLPIESAVAVGKAVARGLGAAHRAGIVHRDVKPGNIMLDSRHGARLTDFGIAKATADIDMTATGEIIGTAAYLAPEQAMGLTVDDRSDIYALGCVLFECLTGQRPFGGDTPVQTASARIGVQVRVSDRLEGIPQAIEDVVTRAMAPEPDDRWQDGDAMATALANAGQQPMIGQPVPTGLGPGSAGSRRPRPTTPPDGLAATQRMRSGADASTRTASATATAALPRTPESRHVMPQQGPWLDQPSPDPAATSSGAKRRTGILVTMGLALVGVVMATMFALDNDGDGGSAAAAGSEGSASADADAALTGLSFTSFDPFGGDGENDEMLPLLIDGDASTRWTTVGYNSAAFGNLKPGVGFLVDLGLEVTVEEVRLLGMPPGQSFELRTATSLPSALEDTTTVTQATGVASDTALRPDEPVLTQYLVVWLVPDLPAHDGRFRGSIGEIQVFTD